MRGLGLPGLFRTRLHYADDEMSPSIQQNCNRSLFLLPSHPSSSSFFLKPYLCFIVKMHVHCWMAKFHHVEILFVHFIVRWFQDRSLTPTLEMIIFQSIYVYIYVYISIHIWIYMSLYTYICTCVCVYNLYLPLTTCLALGKIFHLAEHLFPLGNNRDNNGTHLTELSWGLNWLMNELLA